MTIHEPMRLCDVAGTRMKRETKPTHIWSHTQWEGGYIVDEKNKQRDNHINDADSPLNIQVGGDHYKGFEIQPVEFITKNNLAFLPGCIVKRICRYKIPGGKGLEDLRKMKHEIDLIIELEYSYAAFQKQMFDNMGCESLTKDFSKDYASAWASLLTKNQETELRQALGDELYDVLGEAKNDPYALDKLKSRLGLTSGKMRVANK